MNKVAAVLSALLFTSSAVAQDATKNPTYEELVKQHDQDQKDIEALKKMLVTVSTVRDDCAVSLNAVMDHHAQTVVKQLFPQKKGQ
ncbi:MAG: hypothetical protein KGL39_57160 [Patescibacteria group bacterium]|nr:hypothetical protein [Patescibacteria group bacterium]